MLNCKIFSVTPHQLAHSLFMWTIILSLVSREKNTHLFQAQLREEKKRISKNDSKHLIHDAVSEDPKSFHKIWTHLHGIERQSTLRFFVKSSDSRTKDLERPEKEEKRNLWYFYRITEVAIQNCHKEEYERFIYKCVQRRNVDSGHGQKIVISSNNHYVTPTSFPRIISRWKERDGKAM